MPETTCYVLIQKDGQEFDAGDGIPHFPTLVEANDGIDAHESDGSISVGTLTPKQLPSPCVTISCSECSYILEEDDYGIYHFASQEEAVKAAKESDWTVEGESPLCCECAPPPWTGGAS